MDRYQNMIFDTLAKWTPCYEALNCLYLKPSGNLKDVVQQSSEKCTSTGNDRVNKLKFIVAMV